MTERLNVSLVQVENIRAQIGAWRDRYVSAVGAGKYARAAQWVMDETAKDATLAIRKDFPNVLDKPKPWITKGLQYTRQRNLKGVERGSVEPASEMYVLDEQSAYYKFFMGQTAATRMPGDIGLARDSILIPFWPNITKTQGVRPDAYGNVPTSFMSRLKREAGGKRSKRATAWTVYDGKIKLKGREVDAIIARPPKIKAAPTDEGSPVTQFLGARQRRIGNVVTVPKMVSIDTPKVLFMRVKSTKHGPRLQRRWNQHVNEAIARIPERMERQLADNVAFQAARSAP